MNELLINKSKVKDAIKKAKDVNISGEFYEALSDNIHVMCVAAIERCFLNNRKTLKKQDV